MIGYYKNPEVDQYKAWLENRRREGTISMLLC